MKVLHGKKEQANTHHKRPLAAVLTLMFSCAILFSSTAIFSSAWAATAQVSSTDVVSPMTAADAQGIANGTIRLEDNTVDTSLFGHAPLDPQADNDNDGLTNAQEIVIHHNGPHVYMSYHSHPLLADTDGDGIPDGQDPDPLRWNVSTRDAIMFQELAYRDDTTLRSLLDYTKPFTQHDIVDGNDKYALMRRELSPYWSVRQTWHENDGFDAVLFTFTNKRLPFLASQQTNVLAIRGTVPSSSKDLAADASLALGQWPVQATTAVHLADALCAPATRDEYPHLSVTGHSLGGFLSQIFTVHCVGHDLGETHHLNNYDHDKYTDPNYVDTYTFNAPRIKKGLFAHWMHEYADLGNILTKAYGIKHYVTANDPITRTTGRFDGAIVLPASKNGHSSNSFFEAQYTDQPGFSVGKRHGLNNPGYQDPELGNIHFYPLTTLTYVDDHANEDGTGNPAGPASVTVSTHVLGISQDDLSERIRVEAYVPEGFTLGDHEPLKYGENNIIHLVKKRVTVTYDLQVDGKTLKQVPVTVYYGQDAPLPKLDSHYEYADSQEPVHEVHADTTQTITLLHARHTNTIRFMHGADVVATRTITAREGEQFSVKLPEFTDNTPGAKWLLASDYTKTSIDFTGADHDVTVDVQLKKSIPYTTFTDPIHHYRHTVRFTHNNREVATQVIYLKAGETGEVNVPAYHGDVKNAHWVLANDASATKVTLLGGDHDATDTFAVKLSIPSTAIDTGSAITKHTVTVQFKHHNVLVATKTLLLRPGQNGQVPLPQYTDGNNTHDDHTDVMWIVNSQTGGRTENRIVKVVGSDTDKTIIVQLLLARPFTDLTPSHRVEKPLPPVTPQPIPHPEPTPAPTPTPAPAPEPAPTPAPKPEPLPVAPTPVPTPVVPTPTPTPTPAPEPKPVVPMPKPVPVVPTPKPVAPVPTPIPTPAPPVEVPTPPVLPHKPIPTPEPVMPPAMPKPSEPVTPAIPHHPGITKPAPALPAPTPASGTITPQNPVHRVPKKQADPNTHKPSISDTKSKTSTDHMRKLANTGSDVLTAVLVFSLTSLLAVNAYVSKTSLRKRQ